MTTDLWSPSSSLDPCLALVVEPDPRDLRMLWSLVEDEGFSVSLAPGFREAKGLLMRSAPTLLVTELRLGAYNGLHLALGARQARPDMILMVTSSRREPGLYSEAERLGATVIEKPIVPREFVAALRRTVSRCPAADGTWEPIRPPFERRLAERRQAAAAAGTPDRRVAERRRPFSPARMMPSG
jgi:DNA-binding response OmpR family regulator